MIVTWHLASFCHLSSSCFCLCHILLLLKSSLQSTQQIWMQLSTEALDCVLAGLSLHAHTHSCSLAVTLMYLNVVGEVEGGLRYWSSIEWWMMQCPYVILKLFRAHDSSMKLLLLSSSFLPASFLSPWVLEMSSWFCHHLQLLWLFSHVFAPLRYLSTRFCMALWMQANTNASHLLHTWLWQGHVQFTLIWGIGQVGYRRKLNLVRHVLSGLRELDSEPCAPLQPPGSRHSLKKTP